jgi:hypothetical protein
MRKVLPVDALEIRPTLSRVWTDFRCASPWPNLLLLVPARTLEDASVRVGVPSNLSTPMT